MKLNLFFSLISAVQLISGYPGLDVILYPPQAPLESYIQGGYPAGPTPFQCSIQYNKRHNCGCAILSSKWVITAAHCYTSSAKAEIYVGSNKLSGGGTYYEVDNFIRHKEYNKPEYAYDIAVVRVKEEIEFNNNVKAIELSTDEIPEGAVAQLTGWGLLSTGGSIPDDLQEIQLNVVQTKECKKRLGSLIHESHICTFNKRGEGACYADSGGPLVLDNKLIGVVNFGKPCAQGEPDAYAKIAHFYDWIKTNTESE